MTWRSDAPYYPYIAFDLPKDHLEWWAQLLTCDEL